MFSKPLPRLSCRMNAAVTALTCQWLMGPCAVNDAEDSKGASLPRQGVLIDRCSKLQLSSCLLHAASQKGLHGMASNQALHQRHLHLDLCLCSPVRLLAISFGWLSIESLPSQDNMQCSCDVLALAQSWHMLD